METFSNAHIKLSRVISYKHIATCGIFSFGHIFKFYRAKNDHSWTLSFAQCFLHGTHMGFMLVKPKWAQRGAHLGLTWVSPQGPLMETCCTSHMGPSWAAHVHPSCEPMWVPCWTLMFCYLGTCITRIALGQLLN